jgi:hypothetical protein
MAAATDKGITMHDVQQQLAVALKAGGLRCAVRKRCRPSRLASRRMGRLRLVAVARPPTARRGSHRAARRVKLEELGRMVKFSNHFVL